MRHTGQAGFTLIEALLSVAIIGILAGVSLPVYLSFQNRNDLDLAAQSIAETLRRAETYSRGVQGDAQWGVAIRPTYITLFKGTSYAARIASYDENTSLPATVTVGGLSDIPFTKWSGAPTSTGTITLTSTAGSRSVVINAKGMVDY